MFLKDRRCLIHVPCSSDQRETIVGCGIRIYFSPRQVSLFYIYQTVIKATFSNCWGGVSQKSLAVKGTYDVSNTLELFLWYTKVVSHFFYYPLFIVGHWKHSVVRGLHTTDCGYCIPKVYPASKAFSCMKSQALTSHTFEFKF